MLINHSVMATCQEEAGQAEPALATLGKAVKLLTTPNTVFRAGFKERLLRLTVWTIFFFSFFSAHAKTFRDWDWTDY
jgi:hypothetical protein